MHRTLVPARGCGCPLPAIQQAQRSGLELYTVHHTAHVTGIRCRVDAPRSNPRDRGCVRLFLDLFNRLSPFASAVPVFSQKLSLRLREISLPSEKVKKAESKTKPKGKDWNVLMPCWALAYFPIVFLAGALLASGDPFGTYYVFIFSGVALLVLTPAYAVIISILTAKRIKNGTNTTKITLFQLLPLIVYVYWLVTVISFGGSPA